MEGKMNRPMIWTVMYLDANRALSHFIFESSSDQNKAQIDAKKYLAGCNPAIEMLCIIMGSHMPIYANPR
jgi:hypothetical protein